MKTVALRVFRNEQIIEEVLVDSLKVAVYLVQSAAHREHSKDIWGQAFELSEATEMLISHNGEIEFAVERE